MHCCDFSGAQQTGWPGLLPLQPLIIVTRSGLYLDRDPLTTMLGQVDRGAGI